MEGVLAGDFTRYWSRRSIKKDEAEREQLARDTRKKLTAARKQEEQDSDFAAAAFDAINQNFGSSAKQAYQRLECPWL